MLVLLGYLMKLLCSGDCAHKVGPLTGNFVPIRLRLPFRLPYSQWGSARLWEGRRGKFGLLEKRLQSSLRSQLQAEFWGRPLGMFRKLPGEWLKAPSVPGHLNKRGIVPVSVVSLGHLLAKLCYSSAYEESLMLHELGYRAYVFYILKFQGFSAVEVVWPPWQVLRISSKWLWNAVCNPNLNVFGWQVCFNICPASQLC